MSTAARHLRSAVGPGGGGGAAAHPQPHPRREGPGSGRHLEVVRRPPRSQDARRRRARAMVGCGIAAVATVMFGLVYLHVVLAQRQIQLDRMGSSLSAAQARYQALRLQVAKLESPQDIISAAEGRLGMRQPGSVTYVTTPPGVAATPAPAAGVPALPGGRGTSAAGAPEPGAAPGAAEAPAGDADWPSVKAELAGRP